MYRAGFIVSLLTPLALVAQADVERNFTVGDFDRVAVSQGINLNLVTGSAPSVRATADIDQSLDSLDVVVDNGELKIRRRARGFSFFNMGIFFRQVTVDVVASEIDAVQSSSGATAVLTDIACDDMRIDASSGSSVEASGRCDSLTIDASSGASVDVSELGVDNALVNSSSGARITVFVRETFRGDASSGSSISVFGGPEITQYDTSSGARIDVRENPQII